MRGTSRPPGRTLGLGRSGRFAAAALAMGLVAACGSGPTEPSFPGSPAVSGIPGGGSAASPTTAPARGSGSPSAVATATPTLTATEPPAGTDKLALWTGGTHLRGANIYQRIVYPDTDGTEFIGPGPLGPPFTQADFDRLAALGANYVNISHTGLYTQKPPYEVDAAAEANLDRLVAMARSAHLFVVISLRSGPGRSDFSLFQGQDWYPKSLVNDAVWSDSEAQDGWVEMWRHVAERYRGDPNVVGYDLMVEPNSSDILYGTYDPAEFYPKHAGSLADWNPLARRITDAIRTVDADTPIVVGAMGYSSVYWLPYLEPTGDARTVYAVHDYEPFTYTHQASPYALRYPGRFDGDGDGTPDEVDAAWLRQVLQPVVDFREANGVPVAVNEFGVMRFQPAADRYLADQLGVLEELGVAHALWLFVPDWAPMSSVDDFDFTHGPDPAHHEIVEQSALLDVVRGDWARNTERP